MRRRISWQARAQAQTQEEDHTRILMRTRGGRGTSGTNALTAAANTLNTPQRTAQRWATAPNACTASLTTRPSQKVEAHEWRVSKQAHTWSPDDTASTLTCSRCGRHGARPSSFVSRTSSEMMRPPMARADATRTCNNKGASNRVTTIRSCSQRHGSCHGGGAGGHEPSWGTTCLPCTGTTGPRSTAASPLRAVEKAHAHRRYIEDLTLPTVVVPLSHPAWRGRRESETMATHHCKELGHEFEDVQRRLAQLEIRTLYPLIQLQVQLRPRLLR